MQYCIRTAEAHPYLLWSSAHYWQNTTEAAAAPVAPLISANFTVVQLWWIFILSIITTADLSLHKKPVAAIPWIDSETVHAGVE